jgi:hypothetical protein
MAKRRARWYVVAGHPGRRELNSACTHRGRGGMARAWLGKELWSCQAGTNRRCLLRRVTRPRRYSELADARAGTPRHRCCGGLRHRDGELGPLRSRGISGLGRRLSRFRLAQGRPPSRRNPWDGRSGVGAFRRDLRPEMAARPCSGARDDRANRRGWRAHRLREGREMQLYDSRGALSLVPWSNSRRGRESRNRKLALPCSCGAELRRILRHPARHAGRAISAAARISGARLPQSHGGTREPARLRGGQ